MLAEVRGRYNRTEEIRGAGVKKNLTRSIKKETSHHLNKGRQSTTGHSVAEILLQPSDDVDRGDTEPVRWRSGEEGVDLPS